MPQETIKKISNVNNPRSPFYDSDNKPMAPFARLILKKQLNRGSECPFGKVTLTEQLNAMDPVEFDPFDYSDLNRR